MDDERSSFEGLTCLILDGEPRIADVLVVSK